MCFLYTKNFTIFPLHEIHSLHIYKKWKMMIDEEGNKTGGRPRNAQVEPVVQYVNLRLTKKEADQLMNLFKEETAGRKVSLQEYVKGKTLAPAQVEKNNSELRQLGLTNFIQLGEICRKLNMIGPQITNLIGQGNDGNQAQTIMDSQHLPSEISHECEELEKQVRTVLKQLKEWLYGLPPEKA